MTTTLRHSGRKFLSLVTIIASGLLLLYGSSQGNRHLLSMKLRSSQESATVVMDPRSVEQKELNAALSKLRYASFGTSRSWGTGLEDRDTEAYVRILSPEFGQNFAIPAAREDIPATCLASMIGDKSVFDVIVMEFVTFDKYRLLAKRLRARFPNAIIISLEIMNLNMVAYNPTGEFLREYMKERRFNDLTDPAFHKHLREETTVSDWSNHFTPSHMLAYRDGIMEEVGGHVVHFPYLHNAFEDPREFIIKNAQYFGGHSYKADSMHPSKIGHQEIAKRIRYLLLELDDASWMKPTSTVGPWIYGKDRCLSWFEDGITKDLSNTTRMHMVEWADGNKHALEASKKGGYIDFESEIEGDLHVTYMSMGPEPGHYPKSKLKVESVEPGRWASPPVEIDPYRKDAYHLELMSPPVGRVKPGMNRLWVFTLEQGTEHPFRVTGISIANGGEEDEAGISM